MIQTQKDSVGKVISVIEREFSKNTMTTVLTAGDVVSTRVYDRVGN